jgi:hypothetical protein
LGTTEELLYESDSPPLVCRSRSYLSIFNPLLEHPMDTPAIRTEMVHNGNALRSGDWVYLPKPTNMGAFGTFYFKPFGYKNSQYDDEGKLLADALPEQLYNLHEDPSQTTNLADKHPAIAKQMAARLKEIQRQSKSK